MKIMGGKSCLGKEIAAIIRSKRKWGQTYIEPFCGGCWITQHIFNNPGPRLVSDIHLPLINMWIEIQNGWIPPNDITEFEYNNAHDGWKEGDISGYIGFVGFACSWGGKWFGGFARGTDGRNYAEEAKKSCLTKIKYLKDVKFECLNYRNLNPKDSIIYCDPPYFNSTGYDNKSWCSHTFWEVIRKWSKSNTVIISEYQAPSDFECIWSAPKHLSVRSKSETHKVEKLFMFRG